VYYDYLGSGVCTNQCSYACARYCGTANSSDCRVALFSALGV
jgi:hypothetical protein